MQDRTDHKKLRSYLLAVEDTAFLQRDELRPLRLALEFNKVDLVLTDLGINSTVVVFGSSRILSPEQAEAKVRKAHGEAALSMADALIAATAIEANAPLLTGNDKHYKAIKDLDLKRFRP